MNFGGRELVAGERTVGPSGERLGLETRAARRQCRARLQRLPKQPLERPIAIGVSLQRFL